MKKVFHWRCHTPNLLQEILSNMDASAGMSRHIMTIPLQMLGQMLLAVANRAAELNDRKLNKLMWQMTLYRPRKRLSGRGTPNSDVVPKATETQKRETYVKIKICEGVTKSGSKCTKLCRWPSHHCYLHQQQAGNKTETKGRRRSENS